MNNGGSPREELTFNNTPRIPPNMQIDFAEQLLKAREARLRGLKK
jgi:hypothetical protein